MNQQNTEVGPYTIQEILPALELSKIREMQSTPEAAVDMESGPQAVSVEVFPTRIGGIPEFQQFNGCIFRLNAADMKYYPWTPPALFGLEEIEFEDVKQPDISLSEYSNTLKKFMLFIGGMAGVYVVGMTAIYIVEALGSAITMKFLPALGDALAVAGRLLGFGIVLAFAGWLVSLAFRSKSPATDPQSEPEPTYKKSAESTFSTKGSERQSIVINVNQAGGNAQDYINNYGG
jgi:hypothetical protein